MKTNRRQPTAAPAPEISKLNDAPPLKRVNVANQAVSDELAATVTVLHLQVEESYKQRDHITLLGGEVDALKKVAENKQAIINKGLKAIADRDDTIAELNKSLHALKIERSAFKVMEDLNKTMLRSFENNSATIDVQETELRALKAAQGDIRSYSDTKLRQATQTQVVLEASISDLTTRLSQAEIDRACAVAAETKLQNQVLELQKHLRMVNELRVDQMNRSRQTEYKTLRRIDEMSSKYMHERDEKDKMRETVQLARLRGDFLEERLNNALENKNDEQMMVETLVNQVEFANDAMRTREQILERENTLMQAKLKLSQKAVSELIRRYEKLEAMYEEAKEAAFQATLFAKTHHLDRKAYTLLHGSASIAGRAGSVKMPEASLSALADSKSRKDTVRRPHLDAPAPRAKTPQPPVPNPLVATKQFINTLGGLVEKGDSTYSDLQSSRDDSHCSGSRYLLDDLEDERQLGQDAYAEGDDVWDDEEEPEEMYRSFHQNAERTITLANTTVGTNSSSGQQHSHRAPPAALPELITTDGCQHGGKRNLLLTHLKWLLGAQTSDSHKAATLETISLSQCALTDDDFLLMVQYLRLFSLHKVRRIDLSHNLLSARCIDSLTAWVIAIPAHDLVGRTPGSALEIDVRHNQLTRRSLNKLGLKIKATPRPEVPLVAFEHDSYVVALYSSTAPLLKIDGRQNRGALKKPTIREFVKMLPSITDSIPVRFPGEPSVDSGIVYPRDTILNARTF